MITRAATSPRMKRLRTDLMDESRYSHRVLAIVARKLPINFGSHSPATLTRDVLADRLYDFATENTSTPGGTLVSTFIQRKLEVFRHYETMRQEAAGREPNHDIGQAE